MHLLPRSEAARDQERIHGRFVLEAVVRQDRQAGLRLHGSCGVRDQKGIEFGIEAACDGEDAVGRRKIDDLGVLEDIDAESESGNAWARHGLLRRAGPPSPTESRCRCAPLD